MNRFLITAVMVTMALQSTWGEAQELMIGSKAPKLQVKKFIKGEPVTGFEKGKTYVVELWATWCGPCRATIPHLSELQKEHKDVAIIGVAVLEEDPDEVAEFVEKMGDKMAYRVALDLVPDEDASEGATVKNWMEAANRKGIPCSFVVNGDGVVAWIGHPAELAEPLGLITKGKWDLAAEIRKAKDAKKFDAYLVKLRKLFGDAEESGDNTELLKELDAATKELPDRAIQFTMLKFQVFAGEKKSVDQALALGAKLLESEEVGEDSEALNNIAWMLVSPERESKPDPRLLKFALKVSLKADNLTKNQDPSIADTLAKAYFDNGQLDKAVATQERVVELIPGTDLENDPTVKQRLRQYKRALDASKSESAPKK